MSLKKLIEQRHTLAFQLSLWYGAIFTVSSFAAFLVFYMSAGSYLYGRAYTEIKEEVEELSMLFALEGIEAVKEKIGRHGAWRGRK